MNVKISLPVQKSKSRKVNGYVKARLTVAALEKELKEAQAQVTLRQGALTGAQMAEAAKLLEGWKETP